MSELRAIQILSEMPFEEWFDAWVKTHKLNVTYKGVYSIHGEPREFTFIRNRMLLDARSFSKKFTAQDVDAKLAVQLDEIRHAKLMEVKNKIIHAPIQINDTIEQFVEALTGRRDKADIAVIRHFIWQVKRKMLELDVDFHVMPVFYGAKQGTGKTTAIQRLIEPLSELSVGQPLNTIADQRCWDIFKLYYIVTLDEMARAEKTCIQTLKMVITSKELTWRILGQNSHRSHYNRCTLIGSSNMPISDIIKDETGARRFYQIDTSDDVDWDTINSINYSDLWASIDPSEPCPMNTYLEEIQLKQERNRYRELVELFTEEIGLTATAEWRTPSEVLYKHFRKWCQDNGNHFIPNAVTMGKQLGRLGFKATKTKNRGWFCIAQRGSIPAEPTTSESEAE